MKRPDRLGISERAESMGEAYLVEDFYKVLRVRWTERR